MLPLLLLTVVFIAKRASATSHWIAPGTYTNGWDGYAVEDYQLCTDDLSSQPAVESPFHGNDIAVGCCEVDGSGGSRPDCNAHPATYSEAVQICEDANMRLCTLQEMLWDEITGSSGCDYDFAYNWVSDECGNSSASTTAAPSSKPTDDPTDDPTTDPTDDPTNEPTTEPSVAPTTAMPTSAMPTINDPTSMPTAELSSIPSTGSPTMEPTNGPTEQPSSSPTSVYPAPDCGEYEDERDDLQFQLRIQFAVNAVLALSVMLLICKDVCCCCNNKKHHMIPVNIPDEEMDMLPSGKVKNIVLQPMSIGN